MSEAATPRNGDNVTWRELGLKVDPIERKVDALNAKVDERFDTLNGKVDTIVLSLATSAGEATGRARARKNLLDSAKFWVTVAVTLGGGTISALITILWLKG